MLSKRSVIVPGLSVLIVSVVVCDLLVVLLGVVLVVLVLFT